MNWLEHAYNEWTQGGEALETTSDPMTERQWRKHMPKAAVHEAGHVVAAIAMGWRVAKAYIGSAALPGFVIAIPPAHVTSVEGPWDPFAHAVISWGGAISDGSAPRIYGSDAMGILWTQKEYGFNIHTIRVARDHCATVLRRHRRAVLAIADALVDRSVLGPREMRRIAVAASSSLQTLAAHIPKNFPNDSLLTVLCTRFGLPSYAMEVTPSKSKKRAPQIRRLRA